MKFKNYITNEAFDKPYKVKKESNNSRVVSYEFITDSGTEYEVSISSENNWEDLKVMFLTTSGIDYMDDQGDAFRVLATVSDVLKKEKKLINDCNSLVFHASSFESSKVKLYKILQKKLKIAFKFKYSNILKSNNHYVYYLGHHNEGRAVDAELLEAFDAPYEYWLESDFGSLEFEFNDDENNVFSVFLDEEYYEPKRGQYGNPEKIQEIQSQGKGYLLSFTKNGSSKMQNSSTSAFRVFATVKKILFDNIDVIKSFAFFRYTAAKSDAGRVKVYRRMTRHLKKSLGWKYDLETQGGGDVHFIIYKTKP